MLNRQSQKPFLKAVFALYLAIPCITNQDSKLSISMPAKGLGKHLCMGLYIMPRPELMIEHLGKGYCWPRKHRWITCSTWSEGDEPWVSFKDYPLKGKCLLDKGHFLRRSILETETLSPVRWVNFFIVCYCKELTRSNFRASKDEHLTIFKVIVPQALEKVLN